MAKAKCPVCDKMVRVRSNNTFWSHGRTYRRQDGNHFKWDVGWCRGSNKPVPHTAQLTLTQGK